MDANTVNRSMYETQPAVSGLNRVSGFDPRRFLRKTVSEQTKQEVLYLDLKYKKLWFRLEHPRGRIKKTALKITEQIAIIEAKVYFDENDAEPVSSFIAQRNATGRPGSLYVENAQYAAENQALIDAGYGIQFCDISQGPDAEQFDAGIPAGTVKTEIPAPVPVSAPAAIKKIPEVAPPSKPEPAMVSDSVPAVPAAKAPPAPEVKPQEILPVHASENPPATQPISAETMVTEAPSEQTQSETPEQPVMAAVAETHADAAPPSAGNVIEMIGAAQQECTAAAPQAPGYTADMPVDKILAQMTPEEAAAVIVDTGTCKDWTLAEVAEKRPASLKWYLNGYTGKNNIMKAGARLMLDLLTEKKAS